MKFKSAEADWNTSFVSHAYSPRKRKRSRLLKSFPRCAHNRVMHLQLDIPDDVLKALSKGQNVDARVALEAVALEGYRSRRLSEEQVRRMLGFESRFDVHAFLKANDTYLNYDIVELEKDIATLDRLAERHI
jgi:hypothetical protein